MVDYLNFTAVPKYGETDRILTRSTIVSVDQTVPPFVSFRAVTHIRSVRVQARRSIPTRRTERTFIDVFVTKSASPAYTAMTGKVLEVGAWCTASPVLTPEEKKIVVFTNVQSISNKNDFYFSQVINSIPSIKLI